MHGAQSLFMSEAVQASRESGETSWPFSREYSDAVPRLPQVGVFEHLLPENRMLVSDGFCQLAGVDPELRNNPRFWSDRMHPEDVAKLESAYQAFLSGHTPELETQYRVRHDRGHWITVVARARWEPREGEGMRLVRGYVMDVTWSERIKLQAEIIERMREGVVLVAPDGVIQFINPALEETLGYARGDLTGVHASKLSFRSPEAFEVLARTVFEATADGGSTISDMAARRADGTTLWLQGTFSSFMAGGVRHVLCVFTDISERKQLERELLEMATHVQQRVGSDLHEGLAQQISGIAMSLEGLKQRITGLGTAELAASLEDAVELLNGTTQCTRHMARGLVPVRASAEGITEGFQELANNMFAVYGQRVQLVLELPADLSVDENSVVNLFHIAQEAVGNAVRHAQARNIQITVRANGPDLELQVDDDGVGFEPLGADRRGTGIRMMRFRAEVSGGNLIIESRPRHGSRVRCQCPGRMDPAT